MPPEVMGPLLAQTSFGAAVGFCSGYALKRVGKVLAFVFGLGFVAVQLGAYGGYVKVEWDRVHNDVLRVLDADGDGELTEKDVSLHWDFLAEILEFNLPSASGFSGGFLLGIRM